MSAFRLFRCLGGSAGVALVKAVNASGRIDQFLLAGEERVACRTNFYMQVVFHSRPCLKSAAAGANDGYFAVVWMYFWFHNVSLPSP